jgi:hypothetical protein
MKLRLREVAKLAAANKLWLALFFAFAYLAFLAPASVQQAGPFGVPVPVEYGGTGNTKGILGDGTSYIDSGMAVTTPTSAITSLSLFADGGATCTDPTMSILGGTQSPGNATGGAAAIFTTTGANPNKQITGFVIAPTGTVTITIASPGVITDNAHGFEANTPISFTTTGALPTGLSVGVRYYIKTVLSLNTYTVSATVGGAVINTTGTQSGVHTRVTSAGNYSWPPGVTVHGCTGVYKIDAVLNETTMTTMTTANGRFVANGVIANVPAYTHTYPKTANPSAFYCDYFNTETLAWFTAAVDTCAAAAPNVLVQEVLIGGGPSWPNGSGGNPAPQIYEVVQFPGVIANAGRIYTVWQQGGGQATQQGRSYPCMITPDSGNGGCSFNARFFTVTSDDPSVAPYGETLDGGPQINVVRSIPGYAGRAGDLTAFFGAASQRDDGVLMQTFQIIAETVDPTAAASQGAILFATSNKDGNGSSLGSFKAVRGLVLCNYLDACAAHKGADTIVVNNRTNSDGNAPGLWIGPTPTSLYGSNMAVGGATLLSAAVTMTGLTTDATHVTRTVCQDTTSKTLFFGSGAAGICLGTSSIRYKWPDTVKPVLDGLAAVLALQPVNFFYREGYGDDGAREQYGFLAEDVIQVLPKMVGLDSDGHPSTVDMVAMIPVIVKAVQELKAANDNLREDILRMGARR